MATLIPKIDVDEIGLKPERDVARALIGQLPNDVRVLHSYPWLRPDRNDATGNTTLHEGESDFLILWPKLGLLVLEVKGGEIVYKPNTRRWSRRLADRSLKGIQDPFEQAARNMHEIVRQIKRQLYGDKNPPFAFGYAAVFPDCQFDGPTPPGAQPAICLSTNDLSKMKDKISKALRQWSRKDPSYAMDDAELAKVMTAILPNLKIVPVLCRTIEEQEEALFRLTEEQVRILDVLSQTRRAVIQGVAGSGKTMLAKAQAHRYAEQGKRTLLLCYNKNLAAWLRNSVPGEYTELIHVRHFHGFCSELCTQAGIRFAPASKDIDNFWLHEAADLLCQAIEAIPEMRFDAVVVDEGQDFGADWWVPIELINKDVESGCFYVFYDPAQNLYVDGGASIPALGSPFVLPTNCRNTQSIANTASDILQQPIPTHPSAPVGTDTEVVVQDDPDKINKILTKWVKTWLGKEGVKTSQIAILSPYTKKRSCMKTRDQFSNTTLTEDLNDWKRNKGILYSTIRSFKGLEADIVVMVDVTTPGTKDAFSNTDFYVGCSRAKHVLKIISDVDEATLFADADGEKKAQTG